MSRALMVGLFLAVGALSTAVMARADRPLVHTDDGPVRGLVNYGQYRVNAFLGIPYAAPPVDDLRWWPPEPPAPWADPLNATHFGNTCAQITTLGVFAGPPNDNEDCLYLNVFTPKELTPGTGNKHEKLPVLVWIHGGGHVDGESNDYDGSKLAAQGRAVVVTINYRLGLLGYLAHPALDYEGHPFGNYGELDIQAALHWVQNNIADFGGDPDNVALGGQSAGSTSTALQVISPGAGGLFNRAIFQSGALLEATPLDEAEQLGTAFATAAGCPDTGVDTAACLRGLSVQQILDLQGTESANGPYVAGLILDGTILPIQPELAWTTGQFTHMPVMHGKVEDEGNFGIGITEYFSGPPREPLTPEQYVANITESFSPPAYPTGTVDAVLAHYPLSDYATPQLAYDRVTTDPGLCDARTLNQLVSQWVPLYAYQFTYQDAPYYFPKMPGFVPLAAHTIDIQFLFPLWHGGPLGIPHPLNAQEEQLSDQLVNFWTNFARTGNPNEHDNKPWPEYPDNAENLASYLVEDIPHLSTLTGFEYSARYQCDFWDSVSATAAN